MKITIDFEPECAPELVELYKESTRLFEAAGMEPWSLEQWYAHMIMFGSASHVAANARLLNEQTRRMHVIRRE